MSEVNEYLNRIGKEPLLTAEEEIVLGRQVQEAQRILELDLAELSLQQRKTLRLGEKAKQRMVQANLRLCFSIAKSCANKRHSLTILDLAQEGAIGLQRAVERFDPTRGYKFSTYAHWWIRQSITRAIGEKDRLIRLSHHATNNVNKLRKAATAAMKTGESVSLREIASELGISYEYAELAITTNCVSLDSLVDYRGENPTPLVDLIADDRREEVDDPQLEYLPSCIRKLNDLDRKVIEMKYLRQMHHNDVAKELSCNTEKVAKISRSAIDKLRRLINRETVLEQQEIAI